MTQDTIHIVINPTAGGRLSSDLFAEHLEPLLQAQDPPLRLVKHTTNAPGDGASIGRNIVTEWRRNDEEAPGTRDNKKDTSIEIVCVGGDGTTHELLNGLCLPATNDVTTGPGASTALQSHLAALPPVRIALVAAGTANALFASLYPPHAPAEERNGLASETQEERNEHDWRLRGVRAMLRARALAHATPPATDVDADAYSPRLVPLTLALTETSQKGARQHTIAHLITSHAFHASILHDSEALRASHPGIERFKMAAKQNATRWYAGQLKLLPYSATSSNGREQDTAARVERYDSRRNEFVPVTRDHDNSEEALTLEGPVVYLACLATDRLEPSFVPAPFSAAQPLPAAPSHAYNDARSSDPYRPVDANLPPRSMRSTPIEQERHVAQLKQQHAASRDEGAASNNSAGEGHVRAALYRPADALDILVIRPLRDPSVRASLASLPHPPRKEDEMLAWYDDATLSVRSAWAQTRLGALTAAMYDEGKHMRLNYPSAVPQGQSGQDSPAGELELDGAGEAVVEYYRCSGYEWLPVSLSLVQHDHFTRKTDSRSQTYFLTNSIPRTRQRNSLVLTVRYYTRVIHVARYWTIRMLHESAFGARYLFRALFVKLVL